MSLLLNKKFLVFFAVFFLSTVILVASVRGLPGNPSAEGLNGLEWTQTGPFESSNDRGRFALTHSFLEEHSFFFSLPLAQFAAPDLAINAAGKYVSLFAPGVSFLVMPGYLVGKYFGASQVGVFMEIALFAAVNGFLIFAIAVRLGAHRVAAAFAALTFLFATPAFTYAVSLSQHHISVFLVLASIYLLLRWKTWWSVAIVWFLCALSVVVDNPNLFFMFPIGVWALGSIFFFKKDTESYSVTVKPLYVGILGVMIIPMLFLGWYNLHAHGDRYQLSGTLKRVLDIRDTQEAPSEYEDDRDHQSTLLQNKTDANEDKTAVGFFLSRSLLNGFYIHFLSPDRGIVVYTPIVLLGIFGFGFLYRKKRSVFRALLAVVLLNVLLYSMWGDPWGGWAFGSRYLIPTYAMLCIALALAITTFKKNWIFLAILFAAFVYSVFVNGLGALGTSTIPPKVEVLALEEVTGQPQKYTFERSWDYLHKDGSKSFVYQVWAKEKVSAMTYYYSISGTIVFVGGVLFVILVTEDIRKRRSIRNV